MAAISPMANLLPPPPVSLQTIHMAGILVDVYGLDELKSLSDGNKDGSTAGVTFLWLHHPRGGKKEDMADIAARAVAGWREHQTAVPALDGRHGLVALALDQRNHGTRLVAEAANKAWREGNPTHAQDMFGVIAGTVADTRGLMDVAEGYLFPGPHPPAVGHMVLGVSLGGHSGWQLMFADERVTAGVLVIGCPDVMGLLSHRARLSKLDTYTAADGGASFLGSSDFPPSLVGACRRFDPSGILFGTGRPVWTPPADGGDGAHAERLRLEAQKISGKRFLVCSGADDKLVPYGCSEPLLAYLKTAAKEFPTLNLTIQDNIYPGVGHVFSKEMVTDAVAFVVESVSTLCAERGPEDLPPAVMPGPLMGKW